MIARKLHLESINRNLMRNRHDARIIHQYIYMRNILPRVHLRSSFPHRSQRRQINLQRADVDIRMRCFEGICGLLGFAQGASGEDEAGGIRFGDVLKEDAAEGALGDAGDENRLVGDFAGEVFDELGGCGVFGVLADHVGCVSGCFLDSWEH